MKNKIKNDTESTLKNKIEMNTLKFTKEWAYVRKTRLYIILSYYFSDEEIKRALKRYNYNILIEDNKFNMVFFQPDSENLTQIVKCSDDTSGSLSFDYDVDSRCPFGFDQLDKYPNAPVAIIRKVRSAIIFAVEKPEFICLAIGDNHINSIKNIEKLKDRDITLYAGTGEYVKHKATASSLNTKGWNIKVDNLYQGVTLTQFGGLNEDYADYILFIKEFEINPEQ